MKITDLDKGFASALKLDDKQNTFIDSNTKPTGFMDYLMGALGKVDDMQKDASASAEKLALGDESYLHNTIIAFEKANLAMQLTIQVRDKIVEAYQEIMRIQM